VQSLTLGKTQGDSPADQGNPNISQKRENIHLGNTTLLIPPVVFSGAVGTSPMTGVYTKGLSDESP
jgi:hypothetical protein